ncbi:hypothetical protein MBLNU457_4000t1 [Dothideomycetes sp. NU457]
MESGRPDTQSERTVSPATESSSDLPNGLSPEASDPKDTPGSAHSASASGRRRHTKSRTGCVTCKQRRVKCDEDTPICVAKENSPRRVPRTIKPDFFALQTHQQESWLLHHFVTKTSKTLTHDPFGPELNTDYLPQLAIIYEHIRHLLLAFTLLHLAHLDPTETMHYQSLSSTYQSRAVSQFQALLTSCPGNHESYYVFGGLLGLYLWASSRLDRQIGLGNPSTTLIALSRVWQQPWGIPDVFQVAEKRYKAPDGSRVLSKDVVEAFDNLSVLSRTRTHSTQLTRESMQENAAYPHCVLEKALSILRRAFEAFAAEAKTREILGFVVDVGQDFIDLFEKGDQHSRLIVMYYGVLLHHALDDRWWAQDFGKELVDELSHMIDTRCEQSMEAVTWARSRVGLEQSPISILSLSRRR